MTKYEKTEYYFFLISTVAIIISMFLPRWVMPSVLAIMFVVWLCILYNKEEEC